MLTEEILKKNNNINWEKLFFYLIAQKTRQAIKPSMLNAIGNELLQRQNIKL